MLVLRAIVALATSSTTILVARYLFGLASPRRDWAVVRWYLVEWSASVPKLLSHLRLALWALLGLTDARLWQLRDRYRSGEFGTEGT